MKTLDELVTICGAFIKSINYNENVAKRGKSSERFC